MQLRLATVLDLDLLTHWDTQPHVIAAAGADAGGWAWQDELERDVPWRQIYIAEHEGRPIGLVVVIDPHHEESHYWGQIGEGYRAIDIWIGESADLGGGFGTIMMRLVLDRCFAAPDVRAVLVDPLEANRRAHRFYERIGFKPVEQRRFGDDFCVVYRLDRVHWLSTRRGS